MLHNHNDRIVVIESDYTPDGRRRVLCRNCGWSATGRDEDAVKNRAVRHVEGCGLCEGHGLVCGEPNPMGNCTHRLCVEVRKAERVVCLSTYRHAMRVRKSRTPSTDQETP